MEPFTSGGGNPPTAGGSGVRGSAWAAKGGMTPVDGGAERRRGDAPWVAWAAGLSGVGYPAGMSGVSIGEAAAEEDVAVGVKSAWVPTPIGGCGETPMPTAVCAWATAIGA